MTSPTREDREADLLDEAIVAVLAEEIPPGPPPSVALNLAVAGSRPAIGASSTPRRVRSRAFAWWGAASVLLGGVLLWQLLDPRGGVALAEVAEAFHKAKSLQFRILMHGTAHSAGPDAAKWRTVAWIDGSWKAPGFRREVTFDHDGVPWMIETRDEARGITLELRLTQKEATLTDDGPPTAAELRQGLSSNLAMLEDWLQYGQVQQQLGARTLQGRDTVGLRVVYGERKADFWVDRRTRQIVRFQEPTAGEYDPEDDSLPKTAPPPGTEIVSREYGGWIWTDIVYDPPLDTAQYVLTPPEEYKVKRIRHRNPAEKDLLEWLEVFARVRGGMFTDTVNPPFSEDAEAYKKFHGKPADQRTDWEEKFHRDGPQKDDDSEKGDIPLKGGGNSVLVHFSLMHHDTWHYQGKGVRLGDARPAVCWYRPDGASAYRVVYGDLSVRDVAYGDLPKLRRAAETRGAIRSDDRPDDTAQ